MTETRGWDGPERRRVNSKLDDALAEVTRLNEAATTLATAVANTAHRSELVSLKDEVKRDFQAKVIINAILALIVIVFLTILFNVKMNNLRKDVGIGHQTIICLQGKAEAQRTGDLADTARIACEQTSR